MKRDKKSLVFRMRLTEDEKRRLRKAADIKGMTMSGLALLALRKFCRFVVDHRDDKAFIETVEYVAKAEMVAVKQRGINNGNEKNKGSAVA